MKKQLHRLSIVMLLIGGVMGQSFAQVELKAEGAKGIEIVMDDAPVQNFKSKADYNNWKFPVDAIEQLTTLTRFVNFLFPDSIVKYVPETGDPYFTQWHSVGAVFTPNDPNLELIDDNTILSRYNEYTVDSIYFPNLYVRYVDSIVVGSDTIPVVDTLIVQFFKYDQLEQSSFTPTGELPEIYMKPANWTQSMLGSNNVAYEIKIPLTADDSTTRPNGDGWVSRNRVIALPENFNIASDALTKELEFKNSFGFSIAFKTMVPYNFGDTMETRNGSEITNKMNYFGHSFFSNSNIQVAQNEYINNSWWVNSEILYGQTQNGWSNSVPGNAYFDDRYLNYAVHFKTSSLSTEKLNDNITFGVYPNPISNSETLMADFNLVNASNVTIAIYDLLGNKVKDVVDGYYTGGEHTIDVSISDISAGMYIYSVKAGNAISSKKITVVE
ncbi:MAG: hypothetical protein COA58_02125 [Bacteroidetes bacterium]|nr:MAG: hypothetical protein COA58_02125 [Bacteroidota bacterium]